MRNICAFDFDGTITKRDTLFLYLIYTFGITKFCLGVLYNLHWMTLCKLHMVSNDRAKEHLLKYFLKGVTYIDFENSCKSFCTRYENVVFRNGALATITQAINNGDTVVIVSASIKNWIRPFFENMDINILATELETDVSGKLTGAFCTKNCNGEEKVRRFLEAFSDRESYYLTVYGDSIGDAELMKIADKAYYKNFQ